MDQQLYDEGDWERRSAAFGALGFLETMLELGMIPKHHEQHARDFVALNKSGYEKCHRALNAEAA